jgi:hypothetical protein
MPYVIRLPLLNWRNRWTIAIFHILLTAHARSELQKPQIVVLFYLGFELATLKKPLRRLAAWVFDLSVLILGCYINVYLSSRKVKTVFFFYILDESVFFSVQFTVSVSLIFSFHGT